MTVTSYFDTYDEPSEVCWAHHHGCHGSHQIWTLPIVPLDAVVVDLAGGGRVIYAVQVGRAARLKPPSCGGRVPQSSRKKSELIQAREM